LGGCGGRSGNILGLGKTAPDEFTVVRTAPLSLPPDYALRPPSAGAARAQETAPRKQAEQVLLAKNTSGTGASTASATADQSAGEISLLTQSNALAADRNIRDIVNRESAVLAQEDVAFVEKLIFWRTKQKPGVILDPKLEAKRLQENAALGKAVTEGETPMIKRKKTGLF
jgi:hypothetical protein